jgi:hypothetical protein
MADERPVACSLEAAELGARLEELGAIGAEALLASAVRGRRQLLWFRAGPEIEARLERAVAAERRCCPFLEFDLGADGERLRLSISAPAEGEPTAAALARAFEG